MPELLFTCPNTNKPVQTGIAMAKGPIAPGSFTGNSTTCPHCNQNHVWNGEDTYFEGDPPKPLSKKN